MHLTRTGQQFIFHIMPVSIFIVHLDVLENARGAFHFAPPLSLFLSLGGGSLLRRKSEAKRRREGE